jgi:hypothetical protein
VEITFTLAPNDRTEARRSAYRFLPALYKINRMALTLVGALLLLAFPVFGGISTARSGVISRTGASATALAASVGLTLVAAGIIGAKRWALRPPSHRGDQALTIDASGLTIRAGSPGLVHTVNWIRIASFAESPNLFLLNSVLWPDRLSYLTFKYARGFIYVIPKRAFDPEQIKAFRGLLHGSTPRVPKATGT